MIPTARELLEVAERDLAACRHAIPDTPEFDWLSGKTLPECVAALVNRIAEEKQEHQATLKLAAEWRDVHSRELNEAKYVPGLWRCAKCKLDLTATLLCVTNGATAPDTKPQDCPNGCGPMWRVTEREERQDAQRRFNDLFDKNRRNEEYAGRMFALVEREAVACRKLDADARRRLTTDRDAHQLVRQTVDRLFDTIKGLRERNEAGAQSDPLEAREAKRQELREELCGITDSHRGEQSSMGDVCPNRSDHCEHWQEGGACCSCGAPAMSDPERASQGMEPAVLEKIRECVKGYNVPDYVVWVPAPLHLWQGLLTQYSQGTAP